MKKVWTSPEELWLQPDPFPKLLMNVQFEKEITDTQPGNTHCRLHGFIQPIKAKGHPKAGGGHFMIPPPRFQVQKSLSGLKRDRPEVFPPDTVPASL